MSDLIISPDDATLDALREIASHEQITPEELAVRLLQQSVGQYSRTEKPQQWAAVGLFSSGKTDTSENAEDIIENEWIC